MIAKEHIVRQDYAALDVPEVLGALFHPTEVQRTTPPAGCVDHDIEVEELSEEMLKRLEEEEEEEKAEIEWEKKNS